MEVTCVTQCFSVSSLASAMLAAQPAPLVLVQTIELPSVEGRIDHLAVNRDDQRLFVAG